MPGLQWFTVRVLLEGATKQECAQAVEEMREDLERRGYLRRPTVDWQLDIENPVFQVEVVARDAESVGRFILDEIFEVGGVYLPDIDDFSVTLLSSEALEGEKVVWPSDLTLTVSHWPAHALAIASALFFAFSSGSGFVTQQPLIGVLFLAAFLACVWLVIAFGKTVMTSEGVTHLALLGKSAIEWEEIKAVVLDSGGNTVVLKGDAKQLVLPHLTFWAGRDKADAVDAFYEELERRNIRPQRGFAAFAVSHNTRVR